MKISLSSLNLCPSSHDNLYIYNVMQPPDFVSRWAQLKFAM